MGLKEGRKKNCRRRGIYGVDLVRADLQRLHNIQMLLMENGNYIKRRVCVLSSPHIKHHSVIPHIPQYLPVWMIGLCTVIQSEMPKWKCLFCHNIATISNGCFPHSHQKTPDSFGLILYDFEVLFSFSVYVRILIHRQKFWAFFVHTHLTHWFTYYITLYLYLYLERCKLWNNLLQYSWRMLWKIGPFKIIRFIKLFGFSVKL